MMFIENLDQELDSIADDLRDAKTVFSALDTLKTSMPVQVAIANLTLSALDNGRWALMKMAVRIRKHNEQED